jgi:hypothetical protein
MVHEIKFDGYRLIALKGLGPSHPLVTIRNRLHRHLSERERQLLSFVLTWLSIFNLEVLSRHLKNGFASSGVP